MLRFSAICAALCVTFQTAALAQQSAEHLPIVVPAQFSNNALYTTCAAQTDYPGTMDGTLRIARCFLENHDPRAAKDLATYLKGLNVTSDGRHFTLDADSEKTIDNLIATAAYIASIGHEPEPAATPSPASALPTEHARVAVHPAAKQKPPVANTVRQANPERGGTAETRVTLSSATQPVAGAPTQAEPVFVPRGTIVVVALDNQVSSYSAASREPLSYTVVQDVIVAGHVVAKAGDEATGIVLEAQQGNEGGPYGIGWKAANLRVNVERVNNFCGDSITTRFVRSEYRRRQGLFGSHQDLEIIKGQKYIVQTAHSQRVCGEATTASPSPVPADALGPDQ